MNWLKRLPGFQRTPYGLECRILRRLPWFGLASAAIPALMVLLNSWFPPQGSAEFLAKQAALVEILAIALAVTGLTAAFTVAIACVIVWVMKGPAYVADAYELIDAEHPGD